MASRGGRGRGGRRGGGGGGGGGTRIAAQDVPWKTENPIEEINYKPQDLFPERTVPIAAPLLPREEKQVTYFLLVREQLHDGPLYTKARAWAHAPGGRSYDQDQINQRYAPGLLNKAQADPFLAVPSFSGRFSCPARTLPDVASRPFAREYFPAELYPTLDGEDGPSRSAKTSLVYNKHQHQQRARTLALSSVTTLRTAEDIFLLPQDDGGENSASDKTLKLLRQVGDEENALGVLDDDVGDGEDDEGGEGVEGEEGLDEYEDESGDDYNAEQYFDGNQDDDYSDLNEGADEGGGDYF